MNRNTLLILVALAGISLITLAIVQQPTVWTVVAIIGALFFSKALAFAIFGRGHLIGTHLSQEHMLKEYKLTLTKLHKVRELGWQWISDSRADYGRQILKTLNGAHNES